MPASGSQGARMQRGPTLPYKPLAGVVPCSRGWLVAPGKLVGASLFADQPYVVGKFRELIDKVPAYAVLAVDVPIALTEKPQAGGRNADHEARGRDRTIIRP